MLICMTEFKLTEHTTVTRKINCFIPDPASEDGGGWSYISSSDHDNVYIEFMGNFRIKHLPTLINLLEIAAQEDTSRMTEYGSPCFGFSTYERDELDEFEADIEDQKMPTIGMVPEDFWISNGTSIDRQQRSISTITLIRASNRYMVLEIGNPCLSFNAYELEAVTALLKEFLPEN